MKYLTALITMFIFLFYGCSISTKSYIKQPKARVESAMFSQPYYDPIKQEITLYVLKNSKEVKISAKDIASIASFIVDESENNNLSFELVIAIIATESMFKVTAHNNKNCIGLMQVRPEFEGKDIWLKDLKRLKLIKKSEDLFDPFINIKSGCYILSRCISNSNTLHSALSKYGGDIDQDEYAYKIYENVTKFREFVKEIRALEEYRKDPNSFLRYAINTEYKKKGQS